MHEANAVRSAIQGAIAEREVALAGADPHAAEAGHGGAFRHLELQIVDPTRATPEAVQFYAPALLQEMALGTVTFDVFVRVLKCSMCGRPTHAEPVDPVCHSCGAPVPRQDGPAIVAHWTRPVDVPAGHEPPPRDTAAALADRERHRPRKHPG